MKMKKFLLLAAATMLISPAFAEDLAPGDTGTQQPTDNATLTLTLPAFIDIKTQTTTTNGGTITFENDYSNLLMQNQISAKWQVITNKATTTTTGDGGASVEVADDAVLLTAKAGTTGYNALGASSDSAFYIVFANTSKAPDQQSVESARTLGASTNNPNAFAVKVTPSIVAVADTGATLPTPDYTNKEQVKYPLTNGIYTMTYTFEKVANTNTFSTKDTNGTYTATLTLTQQST